MIKRNVLKFFVESHTGGTSSFPSDNQGSSGLKTFPAQVDYGQKLGITPMQSASELDRCRQGQKY